MNLLQFRFEPEDQWHGRLTAKLSVNGFAGRGSAWFNTEELRSFAASLSAFPLPIDAPGIDGGLGIKEDGSPEKTLLAVSVNPHNARGYLRVTVTLAEEAPNPEFEDISCSLVARFLVTYGDIGQFGPEFSDLLAGQAVEASLRCSN